MIGWALSMVLLQPSKILGYLRITTFFTVLGPRPGLSQKTFKMYAVRSWTDAEVSNYAERKAKNFDKFCRCLLDEKEIRQAC